MRLRSWTVCVALCAVLAPAAAAASVCEGQVPLSFLYPASGELYVPSNVKIYVGEAWTDDGSVLELRANSGLEVSLEATVIQSGGSQLTVLTPSVVLTHDAYHQIQVAPDGGEVRLSVFATVDEPDHSAPQIPGDDGFEPLWDSTETPGCASSARLELRLPEIETVMMVEIADGEELDKSVPFDPERLEGTVHGLVFEEGWPDFFEIGRAPCLSNWPDAAPGEATQVRFAALDEAGNFSGWGQWQDVAIPLAGGPVPAGDLPSDEGGTGCALARSAELGGLMLLLLLLPAAAAGRLRALEQK